jgi:hypothetical protein
MTISDVGRRQFLRTSGIAAVTWGLPLGLKPWLPAALVGTDNTNPDNNPNRLPISPAHRGSRPLRSVRVGTPVSNLESVGDTWVAAWADDDNLYSPSNDTNGFNNATSANIAFNRLSGNDPQTLSGTTVNPMTEYGKSGAKGPDDCTWKSSGCTYLDGVLYWVVARHQYGETSGDPHRRQIAQNASIIKSTDLGRTWRRPGHENLRQPMFPGRRFATPYFVQYGRGRVSVDNADRYVYAISNNGFWDCGDQMVLGRVRRSEIGLLNGADWEFFTGGDGGQGSAWSRDVNEARPVVQQAGRLGMTGAVYLPALKRYLMIGWYYPAGGGKMKGAGTHTVWDFYEAPRPWGPWTQIGSHDSSPQGYYSPQVCPKFQTDNQVFVLTAGFWDDPKSYRMTVVPLELGSETAPASTASPRYRSRQYIQNWRK